MKAFNALEWQIAGRYLRARRRESFISVISAISFLGIMLGVGTLIVVMAVMTGFRADLLDRILGINGHAVVLPYNGQFEDRQALSARLQSIDGVVLATPVIEGQAMFSSGASVRGVLVRGLPEDKLKQITRLAQSIEAGTLDGMSARKGVAIGGRLANSAGLSVGDNIALIAPRGAVTPFGTAPRVRQFPIVAIFNIGMSEFDSNFVFMPIDAAGGFFSIGAQGGSIDIVLDDPDMITERAVALRDEIGAAHYLRDWKQRNQTLSGALEVERNVMFLILTMILLVASLNIVSSMVMLVRDKGRDIAVLRSMGASRAMVMRIFFITGASIGVVGTIAGLGIGTLFCAYIEELRQFLIWLTGAELFPAQVYFLDKMPARMVPSDVIQITVIALSLSFISTLYPAWRAAALEPVEALRYE
jgi:lipoprotein-releasing system permease protein